MLRPSPRYGRHGWHMVCHMVSWGTIKSYLSNLQTWKNAFPAKPIFFKMPTLPCISTSTQPLAATCSHSQPLAATRVAASGCKCGRKWPQVAAPSEWPQVAASGRPRQFPASGRKWPQVAAPSEWPQVAAFCDFNFHPQRNLPPCYITFISHTHTLTHMHIYTYVYIHTYIYIWCLLCNIVIVDQKPKVLPILGLWHVGSRPQRPVVVIFS